MEIETLDSIITGLCPVMGAINCTRELYDNKNFIEKSSESQVAQRNLRMNKQLGFVKKEEKIVVKNLNAKQRSTSREWNREFSSLDSLNEFLEKNNFPTFKDRSGPRWMYNPETYSYVLHYMSMELIATPSTNNVKRWKLSPFYLKTSTKITFNRNVLVERKVQ